jgi:hypothetical protein
LGQRIETPTHLVQLIRQRYATATARAKHEE